MRTVGKVFGIVGVVMLLLVVGVTTWLVLQVRASFPQTGGSLSVPGLASPVQVVRVAPSISALAKISLAKLRPTPKR